MNRLPRFTCLLAAGLLLCLPLFARAASVWTPTGNDFNTPSNWAPAAADGVDLILDGTVAAQLGTACSFTPASLTIGSAANGTLDINDGGSLTLSGGLSLSPGAAVSALNLYGNAQLSVDTLSANLTTAGSVCNFTAGGTSSTTVRSTGTWTNLNQYGYTNLVLKDSATFTSNTIYTDFGRETDGSAVSTGSTVVELRDSSTLNLGLPIIGDSGSSDCLRVTGGTANFTGTGNVKFVGLWANGYGEVSVSGGTVNATGGLHNVSFALGGWDYMNSIGPRGVLTVNGTGVVNSAGAIITACAGSNINVGAAVTGGGTLKCDTITSLGGGSFGNVNFHGGLLETANSGVLVAAQLNVYSEGAKIQVDNGTTTAASSLIAPAGNGVTAIGVTAGGSGYTVAPLVKITTASGAGTDATAIATISGGVVTGITITNPGTNYSDGDTLNVQLLGGGGSGAVAGTAGVVTLASGGNIAPNVSGGLTKTGAGELALNASCTYTGPTVVKGGRLTLTGIDFASSSVTVENGATLAGFTKAGSYLAYPATTVQTGGKLAAQAAPEAYVYHAASLNLENNSNLNFTIDSLGNSTRIEVDNGIAKVGTDPITVTVSYSGVPLMDVTVLKFTDGYFGSIDDTVTFALPGGVPTYDSADGIHGDAAIYTDHVNGYVQILAGGLLANVVPTWNDYAGGDWNDTGKWGSTPPNPYPQNGSDRAMFVRSLGSGTIPVNLNVSPTLSSMIFDSPLGESYQIDPSDSSKSVTLNSGIAKNWYIAVLSGSHTVNADIKMAAQDGQSLIKVPVNSHLTLGGALSNLSTDAGFTFQSNGTMTGSQWDAKEGPLVFTHGILTLGGNSSFTGPVTMSGYGRLEMLQPTSLGTGTATFTLDGQLAYLGAPTAPTTVNIDRNVVFAGAGLLNGVEVQNANVNLNFTGSLSLAPTTVVFRKTGAGTLTFSNSGTNTLPNGDIQVEEGALNIENGTFNKARVNILFQEGAGDIIVGDTVGKSASMAIQNGAKVISQSWMGVGLFGSNGTFEIKNGSSLSLAGDLALCTMGGSATVNLTGNAQLSVSTLTINSYSAGGVCNFTADGTSATTVTSTGAFTKLNRYGQTNLIVKDHATFTSNTAYTDFGTETDGSAVSTGTSIVELKDSATLNLGLPIIGDSGSSDCLRVTGGTANFTGTGDVKYIGLWTNGYGEVSVSGGTVNAVGGAYNVSFGVGGWDWMARDYGSRGVLTVSGTGVVNSAGAIITVCGGSNINVGAAGTGGGTLKCDIITSLGGNSYGNVNFHGGLLETANNGVLVAAQLNVYSEGAKIQVDNGTTTVASPLIAPAGNGVTSLAVTAGGSGYTTAPLVKITTASGAGTDVTAIATISGGVVTGIVITNPGTNYSDGDTLNVQLLGGGGTGAVAGTAGVVTLASGANIAPNISGGLTKLGAGALTLAALPTYTGDTTVNQGTLNANAGLNTPAATIYVATGATLNAPSIVADTLSIGGPQLGAAAAVPEPGTLALLALAVLSLAFAAWRKR